MGCMVFLLLAFVTDLRYMKIPNAISVTSIWSGWIFHLFWEGPSGLYVSVIGTAVGFGFMMVLYFCGAVGGGDVKIFGGIGSWMGVTFALSSMMYSIIFAGLLGLFIVILRKELFSRFRKVAANIVGFIALRQISVLRLEPKEMLTFPFMLAVLPGVLIAYYYI
ncbi:A24 family peptidase [Paenibacillus shirakamiensis]|nr:A24 family peptidase [Paenibacillus shirakamiensis]